MAIRRYVARLGLPVAVAALALVVPASAGAYKIPPTCTVPNVVGKPIANAEITIIHSGCQLGSVTVVTSSTVPKKHVISQSPTTGSGPKVNITVSLGKKAAPGAKCNVPKVVGKSQVAAVNALVNANCSVGSVTFQKSSKPKDQVISQSPSKGASGPVGKKVNLTVSKGKKKTKKKKH